VIFAESCTILEPGLKLSCVLNGVWNGVFGGGGPRQMVAVAAQFVPPVENWVVLTEV
jgi:hypothetical protein